MKWHNLLLLVFIFATGCATIHDDVDNDIEKSQAVYNKSKEKTYEAIKKKKQADGKIIVIDLEELNREIDGVSTDNFLEEETSSSDDLK